VCIKQFGNRKWRQAGNGLIDIFNVQGEQLSIGAARELVGGRDTPVLCSSFDTPLPEFYASIFSPKTLHFVFPKRSPVWTKIEGPGRPIEQPSPDPAADRKTGRAKTENLR